MNVRYSSIQFRRVEMGGTLCQVCDSKVGETINHECLGN
jgi:hypothetical protein